MLQPWILEDEVLSPEDLPPAGLRVADVAVVVEDADRLPGQLEEGVLDLWQRRKDRKTLFYLLVEGVQADGEVDRQAQQHLGGRGD